MVESTRLLMLSQRLLVPLLFGGDGDDDGDGADDVSCTASSSADCSFFWSIVIDLDLLMTNEAERADAASRLPDIVECRESTYWLSLSS